MGEEEGNIHLGIVIGLRWVFLLQIDTRRIILSRQMHAAVAKGWGLSRKRTARLPHT